MVLYTEDAIYKSIVKNSSKIKDVKVTSVRVNGFNDMVGYEYIGNIKIILKNGRYKLVKMCFNSTYLEEGDTPEDYLNNFLEACLSSCEDVDL